MSRVSPVARTRRFDARASLARALLGSCVLGAASLASAGEQSVRLPEAPGSDLTSARCVICHSLDYIGMVAPVMNRTAWEKSVSKMIGFGAPVSEEEARLIVEYLAGTSGRDSAE